MIDTTTKVLVRMPQSLKDRITATAAEARVSATSLIVTALEHTVGSRAPTGMQGHTIEAAKQYQAKRETAAAAAAATRAEANRKPPTICRECEKPQHGQGLCSTHYRQSQRARTQP